MLTQCLLDNKCYAMTHITNFVIQKFVFVADVDIILRIQPIVWNVWS